MMKVNIVQIHDEGDCNRDKVCLYCDDKTAKGQWEAYVNEWARMCDHEVEEYRCDEAADDTNDFVPFYRRVFENTDGTNVEITFTTEVIC